MISREQAIEKGFLEDKVVYLKPIPRKGEMVSDPGHIAFFKMENASDRYSLKMDDTTMRIINPFRSEEEMKYFSEIMGEDLNPYKKKNEFWASFNIGITKTPELMRLGKRFNLSEPREMLEYLVLITWKKEISTDWDNPKNARYCFVDADHEDKKAVDEMDFAMKVGEVYGTLKNKPSEMKDFINIYYQSKFKNKVVPEDAEVNFLVKELKGIIDSDKEGFVGTYEDKAYATKVLIAKALSKGAILRHGVGTYAITGLDVEYTYPELVSQMQEWSKTKTEPIYAKIIATVKNKN